MRNSYKFIALLGFATSSLLAQQTIPCYTDEAMKDLFAKDAAAKDRYEKSINEPAPSNFQQRNGNNGINAVYYPLDTIPIVFHILHQNGSENIPDAQVYNCLVEVNNISLKKNADTTGIHPYFQPIAGRNNYIFKLATKDPNGNCTNGIIHHLDPNTDWLQGQTGNYAYSGTGAGLWSPTKYLNIYIVKQIIPAGGGGGGGTIVGYTYLPGTWGTGGAPDAIVYHNGFMTGVNARSLAHEIGHWIGLPHTFGSTNSPGTCMSGGMSDDFLSSGTAGIGVIDDTPKTPGAPSFCPGSTPNSCDVSNFHNVQNVMDYSSCPINFTDGQCHRMHNVMALASGGRNNLCTSVNKIFTGVRYPQVCVPIANFKSSIRTVCPNAIITFSDSSENARPTVWLWSFLGGTMQGGSTVTDSMPKVSYALPGTYAISYTASNSAGSNSITKSSILVYSNVASYTTAFTESFETTTLPGADWDLYNNMGFDWALTSNAAATGAKCVWINNFANSPGSNSVVQSTSFDISSFITPKLTFKYAYQQQVSTNVDKLQIFSSTDCGNTWVSRWSRQGTTLANANPANTFPFTPAASQFMTYTVNINGVAGSSNVRFRFQFFADVNGQGNNLYLDDINLFDASVGINSFETQIGFDIYPNPSSGNINIGFNLNENHSISVNVTDLIGRTVEAIPAKQYAAGETTITIAEKTRYQAGVYFVNVNVDGKIISKKIIIQ